MNFIDLMSRDEWIYAILLVVSVFAGFLFKNIYGQNTKKFVGSLLGFGMVVSVCGWHTLHSLITICVNILIIRLLKKKCYLYSLMWCFTYLLFFRTTHYLGFPKVPAVSNAVQLLLTLKLVGLAFEISDSSELKCQLKKDPENKELILRNKFECIDPSIIDMLAYSYCYIGLLTGPYFKFRTYYDMLNLNSTNINTLPKFLDRARTGLICTVLFIAASKYYWIGYVTTEEFSKCSVLYKLWYMVPMFMWFRVRMYAAWIMSECVCITSCLGAYPVSSKPRCGKGPTDLTALEDNTEKEIEYDFETIHNIDVYGCEVDPTLRGGMKVWNMSVQYWLATYIYKRVPAKSLRTTVTMCVSAYWHGIHPGYYLSFLTVPLALMGEDLDAAFLRARLSDNGKKVYDFIRWFFRMREFDYMCMGFLLLTFHDTVAYWSSIYFAVHLTILGNILIGLVAKNLLPKPKPKES